MSWNGTVRCSHCYGNGHNRRSCPDLKENMEKEKARAERTGESMGWTAKCYFEKKDGAKVRKCTFCSKEGHNRATCPTLANAIKEYNKSNKKFRKIVLKYMKKNGIGVGSLVSIPDGMLYVSGFGYLNDTLGVVTDIGWDAILVGTANGRAPQALHVTSFGGNYAGSKLTMSIPVYQALEGEGNPMMWMPGNSNNSSPGLAPIASPTSSSFVNAPEGWTDDLPKRAAKEIFKDQEWGGCYSYTKKVWLDDTCDVLERAKEWELWKDSDYADFLKGKTSE